MTAYDIYCFCRMLMKRNKPPITTFELSKEHGYYKLLFDHLMVTNGLTSNNVKDFLRVAYNSNPDNFDPYKLINDEYLQLYMNWKRTESTVALYYTQLLDSIVFIENFCLKKDLIFSEYCDKYIVKHIRETKIDWIIPVYLKIIDRKTLNTIDKILLKSFLSKYNILEKRLQNNQELVTIIKTRIDQMIELLNHNKQVGYDCVSHD